MPQFILDTGGRESTLKYEAASDFVRGYIEAMLFTDTGGDSEIQDADLSQLALETWRKIVLECRAFKRTNRELLDKAIEHGGDEREPYNETRAGHDYWYTSQGHGTGYWDRGLGEIGEALAKAARHHEKNLYRGDDGLIYLD